MIGVIIQARMNSTRFPGKVLAKLQGRPVLAHIVERCKSSRVHRVVVATSHEPIDNPIAEWCVSNSVDFARGSEVDVLGRVIQAARWHNIETIVRVNGDSPCVQPVWIDSLIERFIDCDYAAYVINGIPAVQHPIGMPEIVSLQALEKLHAYADNLREHVTWGCYHTPEIRRHWVESYPIHGRWVVDFPEDLERLERCEGLDVYR